MTMVVRGPKRFLLHVGLVAFVASATVLGAAPWLTGTASAGCNLGHQQVVGWDSADPVTFGERGHIHVNDITFSSLDHAIHRSFYVTFNPNNYVEVGWTGNNPPGVEIAPDAYIEWVNRGTDSGLIKKGAVTPGTNPEFRAQDVNADSIWSFYKGTDLLGGTPQLSFHYGQPETNSERRSSCDTGWARYYDLRECDSNGTCDWNIFNNLHCEFDTMDAPNGYHFERDTNDEAHVFPGDSGPCD